MSSADDGAVSALMTSAEEEGDGCKGDDQGYADTDCDAYGYLSGAAYA